MPVWCASSCFVCCASSICTVFPPTVAGAGVVLSQAVELSRVKDEKSLDFFFREVEVMRVRLLTIIVWSHDGKTLELKMAKYRQPASLTLVPCSRHTP